MRDSEAWRKYVALYEAEEREILAKLMTYPQTRIGAGVNPSGGMSFDIHDPLEGDPERQAERDKEIDTYNKAIEATKHSKMFRNVGFPDRCAERGIFARLLEPRDTFLSKSRKPLTKAYLTQFGADIKASKQRGLIFCGNVGTGKTYIAAGIAQVLCFSDITCRYILMSELLEKIRKATSYKSGKSVRAVVCETLDHNFVVLDEVGRSLTPSNTGALFEIFDVLWNSEHSYIIITNKSVEDFMTNIDAANLDRMVATFVSFEGESWRGGTQGELFTNPE